MTNEEVISEYLRSAYTDERLVMLSAHAEDGKLAFNSCCCLIGIPTVSHALMGKYDVCPEGRRHTNNARGAEGSLADRAEDAFCALAYNDVDRRARIIPLIKAEIARREAERAAVQTGAELSLDLSTQLTGQAYEQKK